MSSPTLTVCFDVACPFAYTAVCGIVGGIVKRIPNVKVVWRPVHLKRLMEASAKGWTAPHTGSIPHRMKYVFYDLRRQAARHGVDLKMPPTWPKDTSPVLRVLTVTPAEKRFDLAQAAYRANFVEGRSLDDPDLVKGFADQAGVTIEHADTEGRRLLEENTEDAIQKGAYGVPTFFVTNPATGVKDEMFFGGDRLPLVARALGDEKANLPFMISPDTPAPGPTDRKKARFYFDFCSPWAFLAHSQLKTLTALGDIELVPIQTSVLFKEFNGAPFPYENLPPVKQKYAQKDLQDWAKFWGTSLRPLSCRLDAERALRVAIVEQKAIEPIFRAFHQQGKNIAEEKVLHEVLTSAGLDADKLLAASDEASIKERLAANNKEAIDKKLHGVPTYLVGPEEEMVFGQDRLHVLQDLLRGWKVPEVVKS